MDKESIAKKGIFNYNIKSVFLEEFILSIFLYKMVSRKSQRKPIFVNLIPQSSIGRLLEITLPTSQP